MTAGRRAPRAPARELGDETHLFGSVAAPVRWRRSERARRVSLRIDTGSGAVIVTLPRRASRATGAGLLRQHADWLGERLAALPSALRFAAAATIPLDGAPFTVEHRPDARGGAWIEGDRIVVTGGSEFLARRLGEFLRAEARRRLSALAAAIAAPAGLAPRRIAIKDTRTRWGSCTGTGTIMFNWRLVMAPPFVQHYVVAHELAHLRHMDHGRAFWHLVAELTPHERAAEEWLKGHGAQLLRTG